MTTDTPNIPQAAADLPPLPHTNYNGYSDGSEPLYTAEQMQDYARAVVEEASRAAQQIAKCCGRAMSLGVDCAEHGFKPAYLPDVAMPERARVLDEVAAWYADKGWLLDEDNVPASIRALAAQPAEGSAHAISLPFCISDELACALTARNAEGSAQVASGVQWIDRLSYDAQVDEWAIERSNLESEIESLKSKRGVARDLDVEAELLAAADAVVARWDSPKWKDEAPTADFIARLRRAADACRSGDKANSAPPDEPDAWGIERRDGKLEYISKTRAESEDWLHYGGGRKLVALDIRRTPSAGSVGTQADRAPAPKTYRTKLKSGKRIKAEIPREQQGWWADVCPGQTLTLRDATAADIARCCINEGNSRDPADYLCETFPGGALVNRIAIQKLTEVGAASTHTKEST